MILLSFSSQLKLFSISLMLENWKANETRPFALWDFVNSASAKGQMLAFHPAMFS